MIYNTSTVLSLMEEGWKLSRTHRHGLRPILTRHPDEPSQVVAGTIVTILCRMGAIIPDPQTHVRNMTFYIIKPETQKEGDSS